MYQIRILWEVCQKIVMRESRKNTHHSHDQYSILGGRGDDLESPNLWNWWMRVLDSSKRKSAGRESRAFFSSIVYLLMTWRGVGPLFCAIIWRGRCTHPGTGADFRVRLSSCSSKVSKF